MWCYIRHDDIDNFIYQYPIFEDIFNDIILYETSDAYFVPRHLYKSFPSQYLHIYEGKDTNIDFHKIMISFTGSLRENQIPIMKHILNIYKNQGFLNGIIKARPGIGKTVMSTFLATKLGLKTIIIVDNSNLLKQWVNAFYQFTDVGVDNMSIFKQKLFQVDTPITIAMIQTLTRRLKTDLKKTYDIINNNHFGLVIYDEVHNTSSAQEFSKGSLLFRTKNIIGLSATPFQTGASEILMLNTIGDILYESNDYELTPKYKFVYYESNLNNKYKFAINKVTDYKIRKAVYNKAIVECDSYFELMLDYTNKLLRDNHKIMIICFTRKQVELISKKLSDNSVENTMFYGGQKNLNYDENVIVATYSFAGKGFDYDKLSAMILACPLSGKKSLIQVVGRILRTCPGKTAPEVVDLVDLSMPAMFVPEVKMKKGIIRNEFKCEIVEEEYAS